MTNTEPVEIAACRKHDTTTRSEPVPLDDYGDCWLCLLHARVLKVSKPGGGTVLIDEWQEIDQWAREDWEGSHYQKAVEIRTQPAMVLRRWRWDVGPVLARMSVKVRICSWCGAYMGHEILRASDAILEDEAMESHGQCDSCRDDMGRDLDELTEAESAREAAVPKEHDGFLHLPDGRKIYDPVGWICDRLGWK